jgi:DNA-binding HxlR family transcriptional regulator
MWKDGVVPSMLPTLNEECDPAYAKVDSVLELITKSKSLHILMVLDRARRSLRFTEIKHRVDASSTTVSRRLGELEKGGLVIRAINPQSPQSNLYSLTDDGRLLSPIMQSMFDWAKDWRNDG